MLATRRKSQTNRKPGFMQRLARDIAGNTAAIMAAALIPLAGFTGAALDTARLYVVKVRLQQSCDAGALAGRKMMTGTSLTDDNKTQARLFFSNNFKSGWFKTTAVSFTPEDTADGQVKGSASATVPVTMMSMFGAGPTTLSVTCEARKEIGDVDVMFVLDTTGSMSCLASTAQTTCDASVVNNTTKTAGVWSVPEANGSRIDSLRGAVVTFYDTLAAAADANSRIRYGIVPYSSTVNLGGGVLPTTDIADQALYPTRVRTADANGTSNLVKFTSQTQAQCDARNVTRSPAGASYPASRATAVWTKKNNNSPPTGDCNVTTYQLIPMWKYDNLTVDVSSFRNGTAVTQPVDMAGNAVGWVNGASSTWDGCVVERDTGDLDINLAATNNATKWKPAWIELIQDRTNASAESTTSSAWSGGVSRGRTDDEQYQWQNYACPKRAKRLSSMTKTELQDYVKASNGFKPLGYTYHDVGMIWGARLLSPNGIFAADTDCRPNRTCGRHIVFMTDGYMNPNPCTYSALGFERLEGRVMGSRPVATCTSASDNWTTRNEPASLETKHNARFLAACTAAKNEGITIWVVAYAQALTPELKECASSSDTAIYAPTDQKLQDAFKQIAGKIAELRISK